MPKLIQRYVSIKMKGTGMSAERARGYIVHKISVSAVKVRGIATADQI